MEEQNAQGLIPSTPVSNDLGHYAWALTLRTFSESFAAQEYLEAKISPCRTWIALLTLERLLRVCSLSSTSGSIKYVEFEMEDIQQ